MNYWRKNWPCWAPTFIANRSDQGVYHRPIIWLAAAFLPGVAAGAVFTGHLYTAVLLLLAVTAPLAVSLKKGKSAAFLPLALFFLLGYISVQPWVRPHFPGNHVTRYTDGRVYTVTGVVDDRPFTSGKRTRFILRATSITTNGTVTPVVGNIRMSCYGESGPLYKGDALVLKTSLRPIHNFNNPGGFDYERYMAYKKVWVSGYSRSRAVGYAEEHTPHRRGPDVLQRLRSRISELIDRMPYADANASLPVRPVMRALLMGDKSGVTPSLREVFSRSGTSHLLAISGLHVGIVAGVSFFTIRWLLSFAGPLLRTGRVKAVAAVVTVFPVVGYGLMAGMSPSTQRAVIMAVIFLMTFLSGREHDLINTLAVAALVIVAIHPPTLFSISFQLSFAAVFFIVYGFDRIMPNREGGNGSRLDGIMARMGTLLMVSVFATLGTLPMVMHFFNQVSLVGVLVNVVAVPLIGFVVVPAGLVSVLAAVVLPAAGLLGFTACAHVLAIAMYIIDFFSGLPWAAVKTITPGALEIAAYYVILWGFLTLAPGVRRLSQSVTSGKRVAIAVLTAAAILVGDVIYWSHTRFWSKDLRVTVFDVGQGSAALLEIPGGYNVLVDGGGFSDNSTFDVGGRIVAPYLWSRKIRTIDSIVLSHPNSDHLNGLTYIAEHFNVKTAWTNGERSPSKGYGIFAETLARNKVFHPRYTHLEGKRTINGVDLEFLYPEKDFLDRRETEPWRNTNNNSLVLKVTYGNHAILFPGDLMSDGEAAVGQLVPNGLASTVLIAPHHGSRSSSTRDFISKVKPEIVVVSAGWKNRFNFPHDEVLERYARLGSRVYRTDQDGAVRLITDKRTLRVLPTVNRSREG